LLARAFFALLWRGAATTATNTNTNTTKRARARANKL